MRALVLSHVYHDRENRRKLRELASLGWSMTVAVPGGSSESDGQLRVAPVPATGPADDPEGRRWSRRALRKLFSDVRPDLVQIEEEPGTSAALAAAREARRLEIPVVLFSWDSVPRDRGWRERRRHVATLGCAAAVIGGNSLAQGLLSSPASGLPSLSLPQFGTAPPPARERSSGPELAIGFVGRLVPERGADRLLRACGQLMGSWSLTIAGTGPEQEALELLAERLGLAARTRWPGAQTRAQIAELWQRTDCLVVPSRSTPAWVERWSPVLVEAMAHGVAPVVSAEGALPEMVGEAGVVFRDEEELLLRLQELVADPARRSALGAAARRRVLDRYQDAALARSLDRFWKEVLARRPEAAGAAT